MGCKFIIKKKVIMHKVTETLDRSQSFSLIDKTACKLTMSDKISEKWYNNYY